MYPLQKENVGRMSKKYEILLYCDDQLEILYVEFTKCQFSQYAQEGRELETWKCVWRCVLISLVSQQLTIWAHAEGMEIAVQYGCIFVFIPLKILFRGFVCVPVIRLFSVYSINYILRFSFYRRRNKNTAQ